MFFKKSIIFFASFINFLRGFKDRYYVLRPQTCVVTMSIVTRSEVMDADGNPMINDSGEVMENIIPHFPFFWSNHHFLTNEKDITFKVFPLFVNESSYQRAIERFVEKFAKWQNTKKDDTIVEIHRFIETNHLVMC